MMDVIDRTIDLAIEIQQIPAPTFDEGKRGEFVRDRFVSEGLQDVSIDSVGNVYARLPGENSNLAPMVVSAHLDTVFPAETNLRVSRDGSRVYGPGLGDNSLGVAGLFGLLWFLRERKATLQGDLWLVANTGEEGLGDLRGMREAVKRFGTIPRAYLILEGMAYGNIYHRALGVQRYRISVTTRGGHAWSDYGQPSAIHELAGLTTRIAGLELPREPRTTLNIGRIEGGTGVNVLAAHAWLELDMRSEDSASLAELVNRVDELIESAGRSGVKVEAKSIGKRPGGQIPASHPFVKLAMDSIRKQGDEPALIVGSTDANVPLSQGLPAIVMGIGTGGGAHTLKEFIDVEPVAKGMESLFQVVSGYW